MSLKQNNIISTLLAVASTSKQSTRVAAAICRGSKILAFNINTHRNKYGSPRSIPGVAHHDHGPAN